jgi:hypothetical protein
MLKMSGFDVLFAAAGSFYLPLMLTGTFSVERSNQRSAINDGELLHLRQVSANDVVPRCFA